MQINESYVCKPHFVNNMAVITQVRRVVATGINKYVYGMMEGVTLYIYIYYNYIAMSTITKEDIIMYNEIG